MSFVDEVFEGGPITVDVDTPELGDGLNALLGPSHAAVVAALCENKLDGAFHDAGSDGQVASDSDAVADLFDALGEVGTGDGEPLALLLGPGTGFRDKVVSTLKFEEYSFGVVAKEVVLLF